MQIIIQVDAFTDKPYTGNPAGVCLLPRPAEAEWMQAVAREMNLAETAFMVRRQDGFDLRWFTPAVEVELCGHATLAGAHVLWESGVVPRDQQIRFHTLSGLLTADWRDGWIELDFPSTPAIEATAPQELLDALGAEPAYVGRSKFDYLVELDVEQAVRALAPDFTRLKRITTRGVIVTARADTPDFDFVSRFFAPAVGIDEDPVTGSAHSCLAPYWSTRLGKTEMTGHQISARGGVIRVRMAGERVKISGQAVTVLRGELP